MKKIPKEVEELDRLNAVDENNGFDVGALMEITEEAAFALGMAVGKRLR